MAPHILKALTVAAGFYASLGVAAPVQKRAIVWETVTDVVVETVKVTKTVAGAPGAPKTIAPPAFTPTPTTEAYVPPPPPTSKPAPPPKKKVQQPAEFHVKPSSSPLPPPPPPAPTTTTSQAPAYTPPPPPPVPKVTPPPVVKKPEPEPKPQPKPQPKPDPKPQPEKPSGGSPGGTTYSGDGTFYDGGMGACGDNIDTMSDDVIAISHELMGPQSNNSPFCGKKVSIKYNGKVYPATVKDKCMGCKHDSIDLTKCLFNKLAHEDKGRLSEVTWWFD